MKGFAIMLPRTTARLIVAALFALMFAFCSVPAPAAQAADTGWQALGTLCTIRTTSVPSGQYLTESSSKLVVSTASNSQWQFYRSGSYYALKLVGTDKFITSTRQGGTAAILQAQSSLDPDSQLWYIKRTTSSVTFQNKKTGFYFFVISGTVNQFLSSMSYFSTGTTGSTCASYYSN